MTRLVLALAGALALVVASTGLAGAEGPPEDLPEEARAEENPPAEPGAEGQAVAAESQESNPTSEDEAAQAEPRPAPSPAPESSQGADNSQGAQHSEGAENSQGAGNSQAPGDDEPQAAEPMGISAKALDDHPCDDSELHFVITQVADESLAPASITVTFDDGSQVVVALDKFTGGVAHYTIEDLSTLSSVLVASATTTIYGDWTGQFNLSHGPCDEVAEGDDDEDVIDDGDDVIDDGDDVDEGDDVLGGDDDNDDVLGDGDDRDEAEAPLPAVLDRTATPDAAVMGVSQTRAPSAAGSLARTGSDAGGTLIPLGVSLLLLGAALEISARRRTAGVH